MNIKIIKDIDDPELVHHWKRIVKAYDYFPQSSYGWCAPWWRLRRGRRQLHIVAVLDEQNQIIGLAPLCLERVFGIKILRSFPVHFGDFFTFVAEDKGKYKEIVHTIITYVSTVAEWDLVKLDQINREDQLYGLLTEKNFLPQELTDIIIADFKGKSFDEYMRAIHRNLRKELIKRRRRLEEDYKVNLIKVTDTGGYFKYLEDMKRIHRARWKSQLSDQYYQCRNEAVSSCFDEGQMALYFLEVDGKPIAFALGFIHKQIFYDWKIAYDPRYDNFTPGNLITIYSIENLIQNNITHQNFMGGGHEYEKRFAPGGFFTKNYSFYLTKQSIKGWLLSIYYRKWREKLKAIYRSVIQHPAMEGIVRRVREGRNN